MQKFLLIQTYRLFNFVIWLLYVNGGNLYQSRVNRCLSIVKTNTYQPKYYLFGSQIITHSVFWVSYYLIFSFVWADTYGMNSSFFLELILLPARMLAVYISLYWLFPKFILTRKYWFFIISLIGLLMVCSFLQRIFIHLFYEEILIQANTSFWDIKSLLKASLLINTTVILAICIKSIGFIDHFYNHEKENQRIHLKTKRKTHIIKPDQILYVEGLGNYVNFYLDDGTKITHYNSIKRTLNSLGTNFKRVHKSFIINTEHIDSFNSEFISVANKEIPRSKSVSDEDLLQA